MVRRHNQRLCVTKQDILDEIRRTAAANNGVPLGQERFSKETGVRQTEWYGKHWVRWSDALKEAGFSPNTYQGAYPVEVLISSLVALTRELGHFPGAGEVRLKGSQDTSFPSHNTFARLGGKRERIAKVIAYCQGREGFEDVLSMLSVVAPPDPPVPPPTSTPRFGSVYLLKGPGQRYKVGKTYAFGRRSRELSIQLPFETRRIHVIETDDPDGVEVYWHRRFASKRINSEWFELDGDDVAAFKRWKRLR